MITNPENFLKRMSALKQIRGVIEKRSNREFVLMILKVACVTTFLCRGWEHLFIQDQFFNFSSYFLRQDLQVPDALITGVTRFIGVSYLICSYAAFRIEKLRSVYSGVILWGVVNLLALVCLKCLNKNLWAGLFLEQTMQWATPLFLLWFVSGAGRLILPALKVCIAMTFVGHGLFAVGYHQTPGSFIAMVTHLTPIESWESAVGFLNVVGILDFVVAAGLFIPRLSIYCLWYCTLWGCLTALARFGAHFDHYGLLQIVSSGIHGSLIRLPHGLLPFVGTQPSFSSSPDPE